MASNRTHEIIHYLYMEQLNVTVFSIDIMLSIDISIFLLRKQLLIDDKQWLTRMISHHSTALTTSNIIYNKTNNININNHRNRSLIHKKKKFKS